MDAQFSLQQSEIERYLQQNQVYQLFENLMKDLIMELPEDPLTFLANRVNQPESMFLKIDQLIFIVGPPGSNVREICLQISDYLGFTCVSVAGLLRKEISKKSNLGQQIDQSIKNHELVQNEVVIEIVSKYLKEIQKENKNIILEGYPKTLAQAQAFQAKGIIPTNFILINYPDSVLYDGLKYLFQVSDKLSLLDSETEHFTIEQKEKIIENTIKEYKLYFIKIEILNKFFKLINKYFKSMDNFRKRKSSKILMYVLYFQKLLKHKNINNNPNRSSQVLVLGAPGSGCTSLCQNLSLKYGFVHVSIKHMINNHITNKTKIGLLVNECLQKDEDIPDPILIDMIEERINKKDCQMQGFVLDGFPMNISQLQSISSMKINPGFIFILELEEADEISFERLQQKSNRNQIQKRFYFYFRLQNWKNFIKDIENTFSSQIYKINAQNSSKYVLEQADFHIQYKN